MKMTTHKQQFNKHYGFKLNQSHSLRELSEISKIPFTILKEVDSRGRGAWKTNIRSVRTKQTFRKNEDLPRSQKLSAEQWGLARVYAFINKILKGSVLDHDRDLAKKIIYNIKKDMPKKLTLAQQREIISSLPEETKMKTRTLCVTCQLKGGGLKEILNKARDFLGPLVKEVGPKVFKEFIVPLLLKKAKEQFGVGLKLPGQGTHNPWISYCKKVMAEEKCSYKDAMKIAKKTYKKK